MAVKNLSLTWPQAGFNEAAAFSQQPKGTTPDAQNVRPFDVVSGRLRGGQRPGLSRHINAQVSGTNPIQCLQKFVLNADYSAANTLAVRSIKFLAVCNGTVKVGTTSYATPTNGASAFTAAAPVVYATNFHDDVYFADELVNKFFDSSGNTISAWTASTAGTFPTGNSKFCRLIATYNERTILSGLGSDPQNYFAPAVGDPHDFDYNPTGQPSTRAFAGNQGNAGSISDKITCIAPIPNADYCLFGGDHSIWQMSGDIAAGGRMDQLSDTVGMAWGRPFCFNRQGLMYFWSSRGGFYSIKANGLPRAISDLAIPEELKEVNTTSSLITMEWDDRYQGVYIHITDLGGGAGKNYYFHEPTESFWKDVYADALHNPVCSVLYDGDDPDDRAILIGCQDGYVRKIDRDVYSDDLSAIDSYVYIGQLYFKGMSNVQLREMQVTLPTASSDVVAKIYGGQNPEEAFASTAILWQGTFLKGQSQAFHPNTMQSSLFIKLGNSTLGETWSLEKMDVTLAGTGRAIQRLSN